MKFPVQRSATSFAFLLLILSSSLSFGWQGPVVSVPGGQVRGEVLKDGGAVFRGIPFAQPPLADLRWREPMPVKPWTGVREATVFGGECAQNPMWGHAKVVNEDCLYLNVWTPAMPPTSLKPVMVWIHGGGNVAGSGRENGESLSRHGVVLVNFNYRLAVFGFFAHPALTAESPHHASGNYGLMDQIAALKWVHENIKSFGGDPSNVTIFGESAGAMDVNLLMTAPQAKGLFQRVIAESGTVLIDNGAAPLSTAEQHGEKFAELAKAPSGAGALQALREDAGGATSGGVRQVCRGGRRSTRAGCGCRWVGASTIARRSVRGWRATASGAGHRYQRSRVWWTAECRRCEEDDGGDVRDACRPGASAIRNYDGTGWQGVTGGCRSSLWRCGGAVDDRHHLPVSGYRSRPMEFKLEAANVSVSVQPGCAGTSGDGRGARQRSFVRVRHVGRAESNASQV